MKLFFPPEQSHTFMLFLMNYSDDKRLINKHVDKTAARLRLTGGFSVIVIRRLQTHQVGELQYKQVHIHCVPGRCRLH